LGRSIRQRVSIQQELERVFSGRFGDQRTNFSPQRESELELQLLRPVTSPRIPAAQEFPPQAAGII
jgi:hypothetical protein